MAGRTCIFDGCAVGLSRNFNPLAPFSVVLPMSVPSLPSFCQSFTALNSTGLRRRARASDYSRSWSDQEQKSTGRVCSVCSRTHPACRCRSILDRGQQPCGQERKICLQRHWIWQAQYAHETKRNQKVRSPVRTSPQMQRITLAVRPLYKANRRPFCVRALEKSGCPFLLPEQSLQLLELSYCLARGW